MLNSDQIMAFLAVMRDGNCVAAARRLRLDHSTVSRRLASLEERLQTRLFDRSPRGLMPTEAAVSFLPHAERIEIELLRAADAVSARDVPVSGTVRVATPEIFGTAFLAPLVPALRELHPDLVIELVPESRAISLSKREADVAISVRRPTGGRVAARKLADYRLGLFASSDYVDLLGAPASARDLEGHDFVSYVDDLVELPELLALDRTMPRGPVVFRSSTSAAQLAAVAAGTGVGLLHLLAAAEDPRLVRLLAKEVEIVRTYWLIVHNDLRRVARVRAVVDFIAAKVASNLRIL
ncbi:MAG: LysR family transcriptional regulator [Sphingomonadaceae bacterium]|nr:LysR family transcriptional regulator [Sphingomonadaceae bacterium]